MTKYLVKFFHTISTPLFTNDYVIFMVIIEAENDEDSKIKAKEVFEKWREEEGMVLSEWLIEISYGVEKLEDFIESKEKQGKIYE